jgi:aryl-alcohol dehydrogenase-like predicted oxidoreductase
MQSRGLGSGGQEISVVGYGAWEAGGDMWGPNPPVEEVVAAIHAGLDSGITWIDTAEVYGSGTSEEIVGQALQGRDDVFVATKVAPKPNGSGFRPEEVRDACRASLKRLGIERIDLYQLHWPTSDDIPLEETWGAMAGLADEGLVRHTGVSNFDRAQIETCLPIRHVDSLQPHFSMLHLGNRDLIRWCGETGVGVVAYAPLEYGLLTGAVTDESAVSEGDWRRSSDDFRSNLAKAKGLLEKLRPIAERQEITVAQLALAWVFHQPGVTSAIAGSRNPEHVRSNAAAGNVDLDDQTLLELEDAIRATAG